MIAGPLGRQARRLRRALLGVQPRPLLQARRVREGAILQGGEGAIVPSPAHPKVPGIKKTR